MREGSWTVGLNTWMARWIGVACAAAFAGMAQGSLLDFDFSGVSGLVAQDPDAFELTSVDSQDVHLVLVAGVNMFDPSVLGSSTGGGSATDDLNLNQFGTSTSTSIQGAMSGYRYISFTIRAESGWQLNLNDATVTFDVRRNGANAPQRFGIAVEIAGGTFEAADQIGANVEFSDTTEHSVSATFPSSGFDGLTGPVEIRLYGWNAPSTSGNAHISDVFITGGALTVVPDPMTAGAVLAGAVLFALRRRAVGWGA